MKSLSCSMELQHIAIAHSSWTDLSYLKHHHRQHINRGYFKGMRCAGGKKKKKKSPVYESELLPNLCLFDLILFVVLWKNLILETPSGHLNSKKPLSYNGYACHYMLYLSTLIFLKLYYISTFLTFKIVWYLP